MKSEKWVKKFCIKGRVPWDRRDGNSRDTYFEGREIENTSRNAQFEGQDAGPIFFAGRVPSILCLTESDWTILLDDFF